MKCFLRYSDIINATNLLTCSKITVTAKRVTMKLLALVLLAISLCTAQSEDGEGDKGVKKSRGDWSDKGAMPSKWKGHGQWASKSV